MPLCHRTDNTPLTRRAMLGRTALGFGGTALAALLAESAAAELPVTGLACR